MIEKSETTCEYINKKNDINVEKNKQLTINPIYLIFLLLLEKISCNTEKKNDNQRAKFPIVGIIIIIYNTTF